MKKKSKNTVNIASPCISVCAMNDETGYCRGCLRTIQEITEWERYSNAQRQEVLNLLIVRQAKTLRT